MSRSIVFVDSYYRALLADFGLTGRPSADERYDEVLAGALDIGFGTGQAYARGMRALGWDAINVIPNALKLQSLWAREHGAPAPWSPGWGYAPHLSRLPVARDLARLVPHLHGTLARQIATIRPDVVYVQDLNLVPPSLVRHFQRHAGLVVGEHASPPPPRSFFTAYDLIVSALPSIVDAARALGGDAEWIPLGFDEKWATPGPASQRPIDAAFVGSFSRLQPSTAPLLRAVAERVPGLEIYGPADPKVLEDAGLAPYHRGPAWGGEMFRILGRSKLVVNRHGSIAGDFAVNMRMYEVTGSGAALITERKSNLGDLFQVGVEVEGYTSIEEAADLAGQLVADPARLDALADAGQRRTLRDHTYGRRAERLTEVLEERFARGVRRRTPTR